MPTYYSNPRAFMGPISVGDPNILPQRFIGDPRLFPQQKYVAPPEQFRFVGFNGTGMQGVSLWAPAGYALCAEAAKLTEKLPFLNLTIVSSTRGWFTTANGTAAEWFSFLNCQNIEPWKSHFKQYGEIY